MARTAFVDRPVRLASVAEIGFMSLLESSGGMSAQQMYAALYSFGLIDENANFHTSIMRFRQAGWIRTTKAGVYAFHELTPKGRNRMTQCARALERVGFPACIPPEPTPMDIESLEYPEASTCASVEPGNGQDARDGSGTRSEAMEAEGWRQDAV